MKKLTALIILVFMVSSLLMLIPSFASPSLDYEFYNSLEGSAYGVVNFTPDQSGSYSIYWLDSSGAKLSVEINGKIIPYSSLTTFQGSSGKKFSYTTHPFLAIPYGAAKLGVLNSSGSTVATFDIPKSKQIAKNFNYAYGVLSDFHYNTYKSGGKDISQIAVPRAYDFFKSIGVTNVFGTGDLGTNGEEEVYKKFQADADASGLTVLVSGGNHEVVAGYEKMYDLKTGYWFKYINLPVYNGTLDGVKDIAPNKHDFTYMIPGNDNDVFIIVCQRRWDTRAISMKPLIEFDTLDWLADQFETYKDKTVHFFFHTYMTGDDLTTDDCEGDLVNSAGGGYNYAYNIYGEDGKILRDLLTKYNNVIWFNGHSHFEFDQQKYNENLNIFDYNGTTGTMIHVPSVTIPRTITDTSTSFTTHEGKDSQGDLMFSGDGYEIMNGFDFMKNEIQSYATYMVYTDKSKTIDEGTIDGVTYTFDKQFGSLRLSGKGKMADFASFDSTPWAKYADDIRYIYVGRDIETVPANAFRGLKNLTKVEIKDTVKSVGESAFSDNGALSYVIIPSSVTKIEKNAFDKLASDCTVEFIGSAETWAKVSIAEGNSSLKSASMKYDMVVVTWKIGSYIRYDDVLAGSVPEYVGVIALPSNSKDKCNVFSGWETNGKKYAATLPKVTKNTEFTAVFSDETDRYITETFAANKYMKWSLDRYSGTLTISGVGVMPEFKELKDRPWDKYKNEIKVIVVKAGVTTIAPNSFAHLESATTVIFENKVGKLSKDCMAYMTQLSTIYIPSTVSAAAQGMCYSSDNIRTIKYSGNASQWDTFVVACEKYPYNDIFSGNTEGFVEFGVNAPTQEKYTVKFVDSDGSVVKEIKDVAWGSGVIAPTMEAKNGNEFLGWDSTFFSVTENMTCKAVYEGDEAPVTEVSPSEEPKTDETASPVTEAGKTEEPKETKAPATEDHNTDNGNNTTIIVVAICGAVALVAVAVIVVAVLNSKKKKQ